MSDSNNRWKNNRRRAQPLVSAACCLLLGVVLAACPAPGDTAPTTTTTSPPASTTTEPATTTTSAPPVVVTSAPEPATSEQPEPSTTEPSTTEPSTTEPPTTEPGSSTTVPPLTPFEPTRTWAFSRYLPDGTEIGESFSRVGGQLNATELYPPSHFDLGEPIDGLNIGRVFGSADGATYGVFAQSPAHFIETAPGAPPNEFGNKSDLEQYQNFRKDAEGATLSFTVTSVRIEAIDRNGRVFLPFECPPGCPAAIEGEAILSVQAYTASGRHFYNTSGGAKVFGQVGSFDFEVWRDSFANAPFWDEGDFTWEPHNSLPVESNPILELSGPRTFSIDISSVDVGETFTVRIDTFARAYDRRIANGDDRLGSTVATYLRDPLDIGGPQLEGTGITPVADPLLDTPAPDPAVPAECESGPAPDAGTLQFGAADAGLGEWVGAGPQVFVTRTGGSSGDVSATFATSDGTATAGDDYAPLTGTVTFGDRDTTPQAIPIEIVNDAIAENDETVDLVLSNPSCTTLGTPASSVLTIVDDQQPIVPDPTFTVGGTVTGLEGTGLVISHLGEELTPGNGPFTFAQSLPDGFPYFVTVRTQPSEPVQVCAVTDGVGTLDGADVTDIAVDCVTPPADGDLDPTFGDAGKVITPDTDGGQALVVQPDDRIVVAGDDTLARYNPDGTLDETFDGDGLVTTGLENDSCFVDGPNDVALQPDGKIVVVGIADDGGADQQNFGVQRYLPNGALDTDFGDAGLVSTDFAGERDCAYGVALQPDGAIVVAGETDDAASGDVGVVRYTADGAPDTGFGTDGTGLVTTDIGGELDLATDVTIDTDGNVVAVARVSADSSLDNFSVVRYTPAGSLDPSFGGDGITGFDPGTADGVAIGADGGIVVAGSFQNGFVSGKRDFAVWRFLADGDRDGSFSGDGFVTTDFADVVGPASLDESGADLGLQTDGKIVVVGRGGDELAMARYATDGTLDITFGGGGTLTVDFAGGFDSGHDVGIQTDGRIVASATAGNGTNRDLGLVRVNP